MSPTPVVQRLPYTDALAMEIWDWAVEQFGEPPLVMFKDDDDLIIEWEDESYHFQFMVAFY